VTTVKASIIADEEADEMRSTRSDPRSTHAMLRGAGAVLVLLTTIAIATLTMATFAMAQGDTAVTVEIRTDSQLGEYLVTSDGLALYAFVDAGMDAGPDRVLGGDVREASPPCTGACAAVWPPYLTERPPRVARGLDAALVGTTERHDGALQVVFDGWPLYTFLSDRAAGDVAGQTISPPSAQAFGASWFLVAPDGTLIRQEVAVQPVAGDDGGDDGDDEEEDDGGGYY
jgi:predicted lipoprotein with Yx(FWY)xxD motif